jgi:proline dehydrogenase
MLRSLFISLSRIQWAQRAISNWGLARKVALRFVAGETAAEAIDAIRQLNAQGIYATLDHLGENTTSLEAACQAADEVIQMLDLIDQAGVQANVSIKLSQMGLTLDPEACRQNLERILQKARALNSFIRVDMEDSSLTNATLDQYYWARERGYENIGVVIQAYLYRSAADVQNILAHAGKVRLCKGAYQEPAAVAFPKKKDVDSHYDQLMGLLLVYTAQAGENPAGSTGRVPPTAALATHDPERIHMAQMVQTQLGLPKTAFEFQLLYGIRRDLQEELAKSGYPVRVYVPYGTAWYPYFMRRLAERPANVWFILSNFFRG